MCRAVASPHMKTLAPTIPFRDTPLARTPAHTIAMNAGEEGAVVVGELLKTDRPEQGFNAATGEYCDLIAAGIIDPTKVQNWPQTAPLSLGVM